MLVLSEDYSSDPEWGLVPCGGRTCLTLGYHQLRLLSCSYWDYNTRTAIRVSFHPFPSSLGSQALLALLLVPQILKSTS